MSATRLKSRVRLTHRRTKRDYFGVDGTTWHHATITVDDTDIGHLTAYTFELTDDPHDLFYCADAITSDTALVAAEAIGWSDTGQPGTLFDARIETILGRVFTFTADTFVLIDSVILDREHRSHGHGPAAVNALLTSIAKKVEWGAVVALYPSALDLDADRRLTKRTKATADKKIRHAWASVGFVPVPGAHIMVRTLDPR